MLASSRDEQLITETSLQEYFQDSVAEAMSNQNVDADPCTALYVVNLLINFARSDELFERTPDGVTIRPLASLYAEAVEEPSTEARNRALRRLGDVALFVSGVFSQSLNRKIVDVDYYVSMGGSAYGYLSDAMRGSSSARALSGVFGELSSKFVDFVDVLCEVSERSTVGSDTDLLRTYEMWLRTGSKRAATRLRAAGIQPSESATSRSKH
ncbi:MAG: hypothetical protein R3286_03965 [Gammaproteobacteria bacterium]|nr:hypothetical protein [Gammaproteobacteria bacterium]